MLPNIYNSTHIMHITGINVADTTKPDLIGFSKAEREPYGNDDCARFHTNSNTVHFGCDACPKLTMTFEKYTNKAPTTSILYQEIVNDSKGCCVSMYNAELFPAVDCTDFEWSPENNVKVFCPIGTSVSMTGKCLSVPINVTVSRSSNDASKFEVSIANT